VWHPDRPTDQPRSTTHALPGSCPSREVHRTYAVKSQIDVTMQSRGVAGIGTALEGLPATVSQP